MPAGWRPLAGLPQQLHTITTPVLQIMYPESLQHIPTLFLDHAFKKKKKSRVQRYLHRLLPGAITQRLHHNQQGTGFEMQSQMHFQVSPWLACVGAADAFVVHGRTSCNSDRASLPAGGRAAGSLEGSGYPLEGLEPPLGSCISPRYNTDGQIHNKRSTI